MLVILLLLVVAFLCWKLSRSARIKLEPPEYPGALPLFGHLHLAIPANQDLYDLFKKISHHCLKTDNATSINFVAWSDYLVADPEDALKIVNSCFAKNFMYDFAKPWLGNGLITATENIWKEHRKVLNPTFSLQVMYSYMDVFNKQARRLAGQMARHVGKGRFDHHPDVKKNALETICLTAMGVDLTDNTLIDSEYTNAVNGMLYIYVKRFLTPWLYFDFVYDESTLKRSQDKCIKVLHNVSDKVIKKWRMENKRKAWNDNENEIITARKNKPFIELLLELYDYHGQFTDDEVRKHVDTIIVSGYETVASALLFTLTLIGSYPHVQDRLFNEFKGIFDNSDRDVEVKDLSNLIYLDAVLKESMRVYTIVPVVARYIDKEIKLRKGSQDGYVMFSDPVAHVHKQHSKNYVYVARLGNRLLGRMGQEILGLEGQLAFKGGGKGKRLGMAIQQPQKPCLLYFMSAFMNSGGTILEKSTLFPGHTCYLSLYGIHRHSVWGKDVDEFRPERWLDPSTQPDRTKAFAVFSMGRRSCIGKTYAIMSLKTILVHFLRRYKVSADHTKIKLDMDFFLRSESGHEISIEQRSE